MISSNPREALLLNELLLFPFTHLEAQEPVGGNDPSPHQIQFVTVDEGVHLEVLGSEPGSRIRSACAEAAVNFSPPLGV